jgi:hypothetical protein
MALPVIDTPKYSVKIPSTQKEVTYRPYLVKEEKVLMLAMESEDQSQILRAVQDVIDACTFGKLQVKQLATFDLEYLFLKLRSKSVGEVSKINLKCSNCEESNEYELNLDALEVQGTEFDSKIMLTDKVGIKLRYPTVEDAQKISKLEGIEAVMKTVVNSIEMIFDENNVYPAKDSTPQELQAFVDSLNSAQFKKIEQFFQSMPSLKHDVKYTCSNCGTVNEFELKGLANFFG